MWRTNTMLKEYINYRINIMKQMDVWKQCTKEEKAEFRSCPTEIRVDNTARYLMQKYL